jgi:hypothetical protein
MMHIVHLLGRVMPECLQVTITLKPTVTWEAEKIGSVEVSSEIKQSKIDVECRVVDYNPEYLAGIYIRALDLCRAQVDLVGFKMGWGLSVVLESFVDHNGVATPIAPSHEDLSALCTAFSLNDHFREMSAKILEDPLRFMALRDLVSAISLPHVSLVDCARGIERIRHLVANPDSKDADAWKELREALHIEKAYLKYVTDHSKDARHGRPLYVPGTITTEVTRRAWVIMNRYLEYLKRDNTPLPIAEFPLLTG